MNDKQDCIIIPGRLPPHEICFVNTLMDDHEGMAVARTEKSTDGRMEYWVSPDMLDEFYNFVNYVNERLHIPMELGEPIPRSTEITE